MLIPDVKVRETMDFMPVSTLSNIQPQSLRKSKNRDGEAYEKKKKIRTMSKEIIYKTSLNLKCIDEGETVETISQVEMYLWLTDY